MKMCITTVSEAETVAFGQKLGKKLRGGEVIELVSDVGGGKTTLTKGIVSGFGSNETVTSPTFTVSKVYKSGELELHHYDFYRLGEVGLMSEELREVINDPNAVAVIEWAGSTYDQLPVERLIKIEISLLPENQTSRRLDVDLPEKYAAWAKDLGLEQC